MCFNRYGRSVGSVYLREDQVGDRLHGRGSARLEGGDEIAEHKSTSEGAHGAVSSSHRPCDNRRW